MARADPVPATDFRATLRRLAGGVTIITAREADVDHAMTATAFNAVSLKPPLVMVCVAIESRIHPVLQPDRTWGVSILAATSEAREASDWLATKGRPLHGQLDTFAIWRGVTGVALFVSALSWLECRTVDRHRAGDHTIVVGEVVSAMTAGDGDRDGDRDGTGPLVHYEGGYWRAAELDGPRSPVMPPQRRTKD